MRIFKIDISMFDETGVDFNALVSSPAHTKRFMAFNKENPKQKVLVQNRRFYKNMPFYSKLYMAKMCIDNDLPHLLSYYSFGGQYKKNKGPIDYPLVTKHVQGQKGVEGHNSRADRRPLKGLYRPFEYIYKDSNGFLFQIVFVCPKCSTPELKNNKFGPNN